MSVKKNLQSGDETFIEIFQCFNNKVVNNYVGLNIYGRFNHFCHCEVNGTPEPLYNTV